MSYEERDSKGDTLDDKEQATETTGEVDKSDEQQPLLHLLLDAGYGIPRETRPRQEKILAMAKQIANFLEWQHEQHQQQQQQEATPVCQIAPVTVIGCQDDDMKAALLQRLEKVMANTKITKPKMPTEDSAEATEDDKDGSEENPREPLLPLHFSFTRSEEHTRELLQDAVYLSPDAPSSLQPSRLPPAKVVIGLLIDRRVQVNRSLSRSEQLQLEARRWPMEVLEDVLNELQPNREDTDDKQQQPYYHTNEPLNVDTILEALQQWSWNATTVGSDDIASGDDTAFRHASFQAFRNHAQRHPARTQHR